MDRAYAAARALDFPQINIDLIAGMLGETEEKWKQTVAKAIAMDADSVRLLRTFCRRMRQDCRLEGSRNMLVK